MDHADSIPSDMELPAYQQKRLKSCLKSENTFSPKSILNLSSSKSNFNFYTPLQTSSKSTKNLTSAISKKTDQKCAYESFLMTQKFPISPTTLISSIPSLPEWVKIELEAFPTIYYISKKEKPLLSPAEIEQNGEMKTSVGDDIAYRYEVLGHLGKGSFGEVVKVYDHLEKKNIALKIVKNKPRYEEQAQVEIENLKFLQSKNADTKAYIVTFIRSFVFRRHIVLAFELLSENLYEYLKSNNFRGIKLSQIKRISSQLLKSLTFLSSQHLIHCDLKPENILIQSSRSTSIKLIDFGSSCFTDQQVFTYIQSRFYRAPEIVLGQKYSPAIDIWSLGCILVELYTGLPIFPAENEKELIACITEVLGEPSAVFLAQGSRSQIYFYPDGRLKPFQNSRGRRRYPGTRSLRSILKGADEEFITLVHNCLQWSPEHRITASIAHKSPYFAEKVTSPTVYGRFCKLSMEDLIKHTPHLQRLIPHKPKPSSTN